jgi:hypothetical protein
MSQPTKARAKSIAKPESRVLGAKAFAEITAVEGLRLSAASRRRLATLQSTGLSADERRVEMLRAYTGLGRKA